MWRMHPGYFIFGGILSMLFSVFVFVALVWVIVHLVRQANQSSVPHASSSALHVLEERYARGEITRDEFLERKAVLSGHPPPPGP
jgi:putative membrane protein